MPLIFLSSESRQPDRSPPLAVGMLQWLLLAVKVSIGVSFFAAGLGPSSPIRWRCLNWFLAERGNFRRLGTRYANEMPGRNQEL